MASTSRQPDQNKAGAPSASRARKGKLRGGIIAISSAAIISIYTLGHANTSAMSDQLSADAPIAIATSVVPSAKAVSGVRAVPTVASSTKGSQSTPTAAAAGATYKDGSYTGSGTSRHGGMNVTAVIKDGKITSANVTGCSTRYPCSDVNQLIRAAVSQQSVPVNHVSGATDSSKAYKQALTGALSSAKA